MRGEPATFNRYVDNAFPTDLIALLTTGRLVRINRVTDTPEPWLAAAWTVSPDTRSITLDLRPGVVWSDGTPFTADDVTFSFAAASDTHFANVMTDVVRVGDAPIAVRAESPLRVVLTFDKPYAPGVRLLDAIPIYPKHALGAALAAGTFGSAWGPQTPSEQMPVLGPFLVQSYTPAERVVLTRNPHYWRKDAGGHALPYLDTLTLEIAPDQNTELLRLAGGQVDLTQTQLRPDDYREMKAAADAGKVRLVDAGPGFDRYLLWFNLAAAPGGARGFLLDDRFRQAVALAVSRQGFVDSVYLGAAEPSPFAVPPANHDWLPAGLTPPPFDPKQASALLEAMGLRDRDNDGVREDAAGHAARFTILVQAGVTAGEKGAQFIRDQLAPVGVAVDVVAMDLGAVIKRWKQGDYDAVYHHVTPSDTDPATNMDWWLSSGGMHMWHPGQKTPATPWEKQIDTLMAAQVASGSPVQRAALFTDVQKLFLAHNPALYFATPRVFVATGRHVGGASPVPTTPPVLWAADELYVTPAP